MKKIDQIIRLTFLTFAFFSLIFCLTACKNVDPSTSEIDEFISKYSNENFNQLKGVFVAFKDLSIDGENYLVSRTDIKEPPYIVKCDFGRGKIKDISNDLLTQKAAGEYFTKKEIEQYIKAFFSYDFCLLAVDSAGNVLINPFRPGAPAFFLRLNKSTNEKTVRKGWVYDHYKNNWYINKHKGDA